MMNMKMYLFTCGAIFMACLTSSLFFVKFWKKTNDRLFLMLAASFFLLAIERVVLSYIGTVFEPTPRVYLFRLGAFLLILIAIIDKNRSNQRE